MSSMGDACGVYGYMPKPGSEFDVFNFSNPEVVAKGRAEGLQYIAESKQIDQDVARMHAENESSETIARHVTELRNQQKAVSRANKPKK